MTIKKDLPRFIYLISFCLFTAWILMIGVPRPVGDINASITLPHASEAHIEGSLAVIEEIKRVANEQEFEEVNWLLAIAKCESGYDPLAVGDGGYYSRGLYQISFFYWENVPDKCAFDIECSTIWTINKVKESESNKSLWSCNDLI